MIHVCVDGRTVTVPEGASALDSLHAAGLDVPAACHDPRLEPTGACRLCLVKVEGVGRPVSSCAYRVREGDTIIVDDPEFDEYRRSMLELYARHYPIDAVEAVPEKPLHRWLNQYGIAPKGDPRVRPVDETNPYFQFDPAACIDCYRCVRICDEVQGSFVWEIAGRGTGIRVRAHSETLKESDCKSCGACVDACPAGALVDKTRLEFGLADHWTRTTCPYCGVGCELSVGTKHGQIVQVKPVLDAPVNKGHLCVKGRYAHQYVHARDRVTTPLIRRDGLLVPATWEEAIAAVATGFQSALDAHGSGSVGVLGSARAPNEDNYLAQKFARVVLGTNNVDCCARVCHGPTAAAMKKMLGTGAATNSYNDIERANTILVIGCNPTENHPVVGERIKQAVLAGATLIVIDPRRIELAHLAAVHVNLRPGTNVPVLNAIAHTILAEGLTDEAWLASRVDDVEAFREFVRDWTPERAAALAGVDPEAIRTAARLYAGGGPSIAFHGLGMTEHLQGSEGVMALVNLALLTGNMGRPGCGINPLRGQNNVQGSAHMGCEPSNLTGFVSLADGREQFSHFWGAPIPEEPGMHLMQMLAAAAEGRLKALWAIGYDVYFTNADAAQSEAGLEAMDLVVVQDLFLNETAKRFAHVFLPAASSFERDGTFMNAERRVQRVRAAIPPIGDSKPDWEIIQSVAQAMGHRRGFEFGSAEAIWEEIRKVWKPGAGMSYARLEQGGLQWPCPTEEHPGTTMLHGERFPVGERAALQRIDYIPSPEITSDEFPFLMNSGRTLYQFNAGTMTERTKNHLLRATDTLDIHPDDAARLGLADGQRVRVVSRYGSAELPLRFDRGLRRGELFATFHSRDVFLNRVTSPVRDRLTGAPEFKLTAVRLEPIPNA